MRYTAILIALAGAALLAAAATNIPFRTQILRPDGTPAAGASVLLRLLREEDGTLREERTVLADAQGKVDATLEFPAEPTGQLPLAQALISAPECALTLVNIIGGNDLRGTSPVPASITLRKAYTFIARAVDPDRKPVAGAQISMVNLGGGGWTPTVRLNNAFAGIATPALTAVAGADGCAVMPGLDMANRHDGLVVELAGIATVGGAILAGDGGNSCNLPDGRVTPERDVYLAATAPMEGTVTDAVTGKPIAGARFDFIPRDGAFNRKSLCLMSATTDAAGHFSFPSVPAIDELVVRAVHPDYGSTQIATGCATRGAAPRWGTLAFQMQPLVTVEGTVLWTPANTPLIGLPLEVTARAGRPVRGGNLGVGAPAITVPVRPDGTFTLRVPAGVNTVSAAFTKPYRGGPMQPPVDPIFASMSAFAADVTIDARAPQPLKVYLPRQGIQFVVFTSASGNTDGLVVKVRKGDVEQTARTCKGIWAVGAKIGDTLTYRVLRGRDEIVPAATLTIAEDAWVQKVAIP